MASTIKDPHQEKQMSFIEHLEELRRILIRSLLIFLGGTILCLILSPKIFQWLNHPLAQVLPEGDYFIATSPFEIYFSYFKIAMVFGFFLTSPFIFLYFWSFIHPGLKKEEKRGILPSAAVAGLLVTGGALFGYFLVMPPGFGFVIKTLSGTGIHLLPKISDYLSLAIHLLLAFGVAFELPLILFLLGRFGLIRAHQLRQARKYIIVGIALVAGILTPGPDVFSQVLMAIPLLILFEVGILLVRLTERKRAMVAEATS